MGLGAHGGVGGAQGGVWGCTGWGWGCTGLGWGVAAVARALDCGPTHRICLFTKYMKTARDDGWSILGQYLCLRSTEMCVCGGGGGWSMP